MVHPDYPIVLDSYDKTKTWLENHVHRNYFPRNSEFQILTSLLDRHPSKSNWKYQEPISFKISRMSGNGSLVLYVRFSGLSRYRIVSWVACSNMKLKKRQKPTSIDDQLNSAMRYAIRRQIFNYKKAHAIKNCVLCSSNGIPTGNRVEVDHYPKKFKTLKKKFVEIQKNKNKPPPTHFDFHPKRGSSMFKDGNKVNDYYGRKWKQAWQRYHNKHASYRYLCPSHNQTSKK